MGTLIDSFSRIGSVALVLVATVLPLPACDRRSPTTPAGSATVEIGNVVTTAIPPECCERAPFSYRTSMTLREAAGVAATLTQVTLTVTEVSGAATVLELSPAEVFGTSRLAGGRMVPGRVTFTAPLLTTGAMTVAVSFTAGAQTRSAQVSAGLRLELAGTWTGALPIKTDPSGDWSNARLSLVQEGDKLSGDVLSRDDVRFPVAGSVSVEQTPTVAVLGLPGTSTCAGVIIVLSQFEFAEGRIRRMSGRASGRCFGTVAGTFDLQRDT